MLSIDDYMFIEDETKSERLTIDTFFKVKPDDFKTDSESFVINNKNPIKVHISVTPLTNKAESLGKYHDVYFKTEELKEVYIFWSKLNESLEIKNAGVLKLMINGYYRSNEFLLDDIFIENIIDVTFVSRRFWDGFLVDNGNMFIVSNSDIKLTVNCQFYGVKRRLPMNINKLISICGYQFEDSINIWHIRDSISMINVGIHTIKVISDGFAIINQNIMPFKLANKKSRYIYSEITDLLTIYDNSKLIVHGLIKDDILYVISIETVLFH